MTLISLSIMLPETIRLGNEVGESLLYKKTEKELKASDNVV